MNKLLITLIILSSFLSFSQENYTFKSSGRIMQNGKTINPEEVRNLLVNNQKALELYEAGRNKKTFGNVLLWGGFALLIGKFYSDSTTNVYLGPNPNAKVNDEKSRYPYLIGVAMIVVSIPIKIGFSNKIKQAIVLMNQDLKNPKTTYIQSTDLVVNSNGIGLSITF